MWSPATTERQSKGFIVRVVGGVKAVDRLLARVALLPLLVYKRLISPFLTPACRFHPTCSAYSREAYLERGFVLGSWLTFRRVVRCHPWCEGGHDPVPKRGER